MSKNNNKSNTKLAYSIISIIIGMIFLAYASVPLYNIFCKVTGYGGTVQLIKKGATHKGERKFKIRFDANVNPDLPWLFKTEQLEVEVLTGQNILIFYSAKNLSKETIVGTAVYNVTPHKAALYFNKIQCFCFEEQLLVSGQEMMMPVSFFIDPKIEDDPYLKDVETITLSYSFFKVKAL